jgi:hypothetical protein
VFLVFACKQAFGFTAVNYYLFKWQDQGVDSPLCPACMMHHETTGQLCCPDEGWQKTLLHLSQQLLDWLDEEGIPRDLNFLVIRYIRGRGEITVKKIIMQWTLLGDYLLFARSQDIIGWWHFLKCMVAKDLTHLIDNARLQQACVCGTAWWVQTLVVHLLEIT